MLTFGIISGDNCKFNDCQNQYTWAEKSNYGRRPRQKINQTYRCLQLRYPFSHWTDHQPCLHVCPYPNCAFTLCLDSTNIKYENICLNTFSIKDNHLLSIWTNMSIQLVEICLVLNYKLLQTISLITLFWKLAGIPCMTRKL